MRFAQALAASLQPASGTSGNHEDERLQAALAASRQTYKVERDWVFDAVCSVLKSISPVLCSFIDEHCATFHVSNAEGVIAAATDEAHWTCFQDYRRTVDEVLRVRLQDLELCMGDLAQLLTAAAHDESGKLGNPKVREMLVAVTDFTSFLRVMMTRNFQMHCEARAQQESLQRQHILDEAADAIPEVEAMAEVVGSQAVAGSSSWDSGEARAHGPETGGVRLLPAAHLMDLMELLPAFEARLDPIAEGDTEEWVTVPKGNQPSSEKGPSRSFTVSRSDFASAMATAAAHSAANARPASDTYV